MQANRSQTGRQFCLNSLRYPRLGGKRSPCPDSMVDATPIDNRPFRMGRLQFECELAVWLAQSRVVTPNARHIELVACRKTVQAKMRTRCSPRAARANSLPCWQSFMLPHWSRRPSGFISIRTDGTNLSRRARTQSGLPSRPRVSGWPWLAMRSCFCFWDFSAARRAHRFRNGFRSSDCLRE